MPDTMVTRNVRSNATPVFISYSSKDKLFADALCMCLEAAGIRCWIAPRDVRPGVEWGAAIVDAIDSCSVMLLVLSANANQSPQVRREVERALSKGRIIIPCRTEDILPTGALEYAVSNTHWLDLFPPPLEQHFPQLPAVVRGALEGGDFVAASRRSAVGKRPRMRLALILLGVALAGALAGLGIFATVRSAIAPASSNRLELVEMACAEDTYDLNAINSDRTQVDALIRNVGTEPHVIVGAELVLTRVWKISPVEFNVFAAFPPPDTLRIRLPTRGIPATIPVKELKRTLEVGKNDRFRFELACDDPQSTYVFELAIKMDYDNPRRTLESEPLLVMTVGQAYRPGFGLEAMTDKDLAEMSEGLRRGCPDATTFSQLHATAVELQSNRDANKKIAAQLARCPGTKSPRVNEFIAMMGDR